VALVRGKASDGLGVRCRCKPLEELVEVCEGEGSGEGKALLRLLGKDVADIAPLQEVDHLFIGFSGVRAALVDCEGQCLAEASRVSSPPHQRSTAAAISFAG
jgi:hypothetical protein